MYFFIYVDTHSSLESSIRLVRLHSFMFANQPFLDQLRVALVGRELFLIFSHFIGQCTERNRCQWVIISQNETQTSLIKSV